MLALKLVEFQLTSNSKDNTSSALSAWLLSRILAGSCMLSTYIPAINAVNNANNLSPFMPSSASQDIDVVKVGNIEKETSDYCQKEKIGNRSSVKACCEKRWADGSFSDKRNHTACLCNTYLFRLEFQCGNRLESTKPWHKTSAGLFDFRIQNREYSLYNGLSVLAHEFSNTNLETSF
jgi:hypothetical protein